MFCAILGKFFHQRPKPSHASLPQSPSVTAPPPHHRCGAPASMPPRIRLWRMKSGEVPRRGGGVVGDGFSVPPTHHRCGGFGSPFGVRYHTALAVAERVIVGVGGKLKVENGKWKVTQRAESTQSPPPRGGLCRTSAAEEICTDSIPPGRETRPLRHTR